MSQVNSSMNFLPEDYVEKRQAARAAVVFIGLLLIVVGGIVGTWVYSQWRNQGIFEERDRVNASFEEMSKKIAEAQELERQKERMIAKADIITALMERVRRSVLLGELTQRKPRGVDFLSLDLKTREIQPQALPNAELERVRREREGLPPEPPPQPTREVTLNLVGTAPTDADVAAYMAALQKSPLLTTVTLVYSDQFKESQEDTLAIRKFSLEMRLNPDADLRGKSVIVDAMPRE